MCKIKNVIVKTLFKINDILKNMQKPTLYLTSSDCYQIINFFLFTIIIKKKFCYNNYTDVHNAFKLFL